MKECWSLDSHRQMLLFETPRDRILLIDYSCEEVGHRNWEFLRSLVILRAGNKERQNKCLIMAFLFKKEKL